MGSVIIKATQFQHPTITSGQHTNGPDMIWICVDGKWYPTHCSKMHKVRREIDENGPQQIMDGAWNEYGHASPTTK